MSWLTLRRTGSCTADRQVTLSPDDAHAADSYDKRLNTLQQQLSSPSRGPPCWSPTSSRTASSAAARPRRVLRTPSTTTWWETTAEQLVSSSPCGRQAFSDPAVLHDIDWYLAESFFAMGNLVLALEAYAEIIDSPCPPLLCRLGAPQHGGLQPQRQQPSLCGLYESYIVPGRVEPTDVIRYTLGRAFHRQGDSQRAERYMVEIPETSYYGRAQYHLGTFELIRDNLEGATPFFERAAKISIVTKANKDVVDLSLMALGRIHYELEDLSSVGWYQQISRESRYFADALYEMTWTFIKDGDHLHLEAVDIFLLAFPEHARPTHEAP